MTVLGRIFIYIYIFTYIYTYIYIYTNKLRHLYLNMCLILNDGVPSSELGYLNRKTIYFIQENVFTTVICKLAKFSPGLNVLINRKLSAILLVYNIVTNISQIVC